MNLRKAHKNKTLTKNANKNSFSQKTLPDFSYGSTSSILIKLKQTYYT